MAHRHVRLKSPWLTVSVLMPASLGAVPTHAGPPAGLSGPEATLYSMYISMASRHHTAARDMNDGCHKHLSSRAWTDASWLALCR
jgi:hypothetical protein